MSSHTHPNIYSLKKAYVGSIRDLKRSLCMLRNPLRVPEPEVETVSYRKLCMLFCGLLNFTFIAI